MTKQEDSSNISHDNQMKLMPGQMLKTEREAQKISIEEVATYLHLTTSTVLSIEADHYQKMSAPVYVRGYLKRYAQFLKLSPETILATFEQNVEVKGKIVEEIPNHVRVKETQITSNHMAFRFLTYGIIVLLLILIGLWIKNQENQITTDKTEVKATRSIKLEPAKTEVHPKEFNATLPEKNPEPTQTIQKLPLNSEKLNKLNTDITPNSSEKIKKGVDMPKEQKLKVNSYPKPSNTLDLY